MSASLTPQKVDLKALQQQQIDADGNFAASQEEKVSGNVDKSYKLPKHAAHRIHIKLSRKVHLPAEEDYEWKSEIMELSPAEFERMKSNGSFNGYKKQEILHDPRPKSVQQASKTGDIDAGTPSDPKTSLASLQAAQMRYRELTNHDAPTDKSFEELLELIAPLEAQLKAKSTTGGAVKKPLRSLVDAQDRYKELVGKAAPEDKSFTELKEAITHFESPEGAADLEAAKA
ncbi:hypothetical protein HHL22_20620 [Hymenobacter sp. RP-2-7]|uniref:Uncharacterized protein n=1 Tax=Hymenobacter polaris TaxID=2682546 RepID=A0A7Y0AHV5_9BACT|nr:hypothetical protein [Hymenobacter polaris]NML67612.1 hypothetical protein [Hymenobacter polaris]